jgi:hypothetical protein
MEASGRKYELRADTAKAVEAYRDFMERWETRTPNFSLESPTPGSA